MAGFPYAVVTVWSLAALAVGIASSWMWVHVVRSVYPRLGLPAKVPMGPIQVMAGWAPWMMAVGGCAAALGLILEVAHVGPGSGLYSLGWGLLIGFGWARASMSMAVRKGIVSRSARREPPTPTIQLLPVVRLLMLAFLLFSIVGATAYIVLPTIRDRSAGWASFIGSWVLLSTLWTVLEIKQLRRRRSSLSGPPQR